MTKNTTLVGILVVIVVIAISGLFFPSVTETVIREIREVGAVVGPDSYFEYTANNDARKQAVTKTFTTATTTVCAVKNTLGATSTLSYGAARFTVGTTSASTLTWGKATSAFATTTIIATSSLAANAQTTFHAATTSAYVSTTGARIAQALSDITFSPSEWLVLSMEGGRDTYSPTGTCTVEFTRI